jgi:hypothetical protein
MFITAAAYIRASKNKVVMSLSRSSGKDAVITPSMMGNIVSASQKERISKYLLKFGTKTSIAMRVAVTKQETILI